MSDYVDEDMKSPEWTNLRRTLGVLFADGDTAELRVLGVQGQGTVSGYYTDLDKAAYDACQYDQHGTVCVLLNPVFPALSARSNNHLTQWAKGLTVDHEIDRRSWLFVDCDPKRPSGISSTKDEKEFARLKSQAVMKWLAKQHGWAVPVAADSGNGYHLLYRIDLPNDTASTYLLQRVLEGISGQFTDENVTVDTAVFNAARLIKLHGTWATKGDSTVERPHRQSKLLHVPEPIQLLTLEQLQVVAALAPQKTKTSARSQPHTGPSFDLEGFIERYGIDVANEKYHGEFHQFILSACPFDASHTAPDSMLFQHEDGAVGFKCLHNSCSERKWQDVRELFDPGVYERQEQQTTPLASIQVNNRQLRDIVDEVMGEVVAHNDPPVLFQRDGKLVSVSVNEHRQAKISIQSNAAMRLAINKAADFVNVSIVMKNDGSQDTKTSNVLPPKDVVDSVLALDRYPRSIPVLEQIAEIPLIAADGALEAHNGYLEQTHAYLYAPDLKKCTYSTEPTDEEVRDALQWFRDELFFDFPFSDSASFAHTLVAMAEPIFRPYINRPTPGKLIEASVRSSGKSLLVETIIAVTSPSNSSPTTAPREEEEWRKVVTSRLMTGPTHIWIDNIDGRLVSESLCAVLTSSTWTDRRLGLSEDVCLPVRCQWLFTANNAQLHEDIQTRCILIRLDPKCENPEQRTGFKIAHPPTYVRKHRAEIMGRLLTLVAKWINDGRPLLPATVTNRYPRWAAVMGGWLQSIGVDGFLSNVNEMRAYSSPEVPAWREFVSAWWEQHGAQPVTVDTLCDIAFGRIIGDSRFLSEGVLSDALPADNDAKRKIRLGMTLQKFRGRVFGNCAIQCKAGGRYKAYYLQPVNDPPDSEREKVLQVLQGPAARVNPLADPSDSQPGKSPASPARSCIGDETLKKTAGLQDLAGLPPSMRESDSNDGVNIGAHDSHMGIGGNSPARSCSPASPATPGSLPVDDYTVQPDTDDEYNKEGW